jgi:hypothetical protein
MFHDIYVQAVPIDKAACNSFNSLPLMPSGQLNLPNGSSILSYVACVGHTVCTSFRLRQIRLVMCHKTLPSQGK